MQISNEKVAAIHYTLKDNNGTVLDSSEGKDPLYYLHGFGNLIPGMEKGLEGKVKGDKFDIKVSAADGYGERDDAAIQQVPVSAFGGADVKVGMQFRAGNEHGQYLVTVTEVNGDMVTVDANHPLAGVELNFAVEVMEVREATQDEIAHGHVHGPGGAH
ncbi:MAG: FKBP-type peptidyl-prolyl cis-trans isomerase [Flavobacteriales bacterium]|jgi:FKBP-type peptidyl-prolyl cis-trans isomerase SlyD